MAIPGSFIANVRKPEMKILLAGRIARAAAVWCVDEIVVFDDDPSNIPDYVSNHYRSKKKTKQEILDSIDDEDVAWQNPDQFLFHVLSFAECPPYLRQDAEYPEATLYPQSAPLRWSGILPSLDMPHHLKSHEWCRYREGVTLPSLNTQPKQTPKSKKKAKSDKQEQEWTYVKCGLPYPIRIPYKVDPGTRVTIDFQSTEQPPSWPHLSNEECDNLEVDVVAPYMPRVEGGYYWGYTVRKAPSLSAVFTGAEFENGYDFTIGTSERGIPLSSILPDDVAPRNRPISTERKLPKRFEHLLLVFGGVKGLEPAVASDTELKAKGLSERSAHEVFDAWVNLVQGQGSRTIRTEEAVEIGLAGLKEYVDSMYDA